MVSTTLTRPLALATRVMQWASAVIVMGITSYFMHGWPKDEHTIYQEVISTMSVVFFLPAFVSPFMPNMLSRFVFPIDIIFSYLWLTAFIFAAEDYSWQSCGVNSPPGASCSLKKANQAFMFLTFIFTFFAIFLEVGHLWLHRRETTGTGLHEKNGHVATTGNGATADTAATTAPADTVV